MGTERVAASTTENRLAMWTYAWWLLVGALLGLGIESLLTIGPVLLLLGGGLALIGMRVPALRNRSAAAILAGIGMAVMYLAWLNRGGPGEVCQSTATETSCVQAWSPWPFVVVAALLVAASTLLARRRMR